MFVSALATLISIVAVLVTVLILYAKWALTYWERRKVPYLQPEFPFGNFKENILGKAQRGVHLKQLYEEMRRKNWKFGGVYIFTQPNLIITDLDLLRDVLTKDFHYFADRHFYYNKNDPLQANLLNLTGSKWRNLRKKLTPTFTSGKMKMMFQVMAESRGSLETRMDKEVEGGKPINIKEVMACFTTNVIGTCAFGLDCKALEDENSEFRRFGRRLFHTTKFQMFKRIFAATFPGVANLLRFSFHQKERTEFIMKIIEDTMSYRKKNNLERNDFLQMLIKMKNSDNAEETLTMDELGSQVIVFFAAGFETSSTLMSFAMYELVKNLDIQEKLREEIKQVLKKHNNNFTYEAIQDMTYLSQVVDESLRLHPPGASLSRKCVKDYKIPNTDVVIEKGTTVSSSVFGIHLDEKYYPNPTKFDPERFNEENKKNRHNYAHLPFGEGPRNCIGMRFGLLQSKMGLAALLTNYKFTLNDKTKDPLEYDPKSQVLSTLGDIWLNAEKI